jgi:hypothetical protein
MSSFKNREDVVEWVKYDKLYRLLLKRKSKFKNQLQALFQALAQGEGFRIEGFEWTYDELLDIFYRGALVEINDCTDHIIVNILNEEGLSDYEPLSDD